MCGVPVHAVDTYVERLIKKGQMVAVCEQIETQGTRKKNALASIESQQGSSRISPLGGAGTGVIKRAITRLITPGTLIDDHLLHPRHHNYLATVFSSRLLLPSSPSSPSSSPRLEAAAGPELVSLDSVPLSAESNNRNNVEPLFGLSWMDLSTGEFNYSSPVSLETLRADIDRLSPSEIIVPDTWVDPFVFSFVFPLPLSLSPFGFCSERQKTSPPMQTIRRGSAGKDKGNQSNPARSLCDASLKHPL